MLMKLVIDLAIPEGTTLEQATNVSNKENSYLHVINQIVKRITIPRWLYLDTQPVPTNYALNFTPPLPSPETWKVQRLLKI